MKLETIMRMEDSRRKLHLLELNLLKLQPHGTTWEAAMEEWKRLFQEYRGSGAERELRRLAQDVKQQQDRIVEAVWRVIVGNDTPKKEDGELTIQGPGGQETRYYFKYKGEDVAVLTIREITTANFSYFIQSESVNPWDVMEKLKEIEQEAG